MNCVSNSEPLFDTDSNADTSLPVSVSTKGNYKSGLDVNAVVVWVDMVLVGGAFADNALAAAAA